MFRLQSTMNFPTFDVCYFLNYLKSKGVLQPNEAVSEIVRSIGVIAGDAGIVESWSAPETYPCERGIMSGGICTACSQSMIGCLHCDNDVTCTKCDENLGWETNMAGLFSCQCKGGFYM